MTGEIMSGYTIHDGEHRVIIYGIVIQSGLQFYPGCKVYLIYTLVCISVA